MEARRAATISAALLVLVVASAAWMQPWRTIRPAATPGPSPTTVAHTFIAGAGFAGLQAWVALRGSTGGGRFVTTADGGRTWHGRQLPPGGDNVQIVSQDGFGPVLLVSSFGLYLSANLGETWQLLRLPPTEARSFQLTFIDPNTGWLHAFGDGSDAKTYLWSTSDGGTTWTPLDPAGLPAAAPTGPLRFDNPLHGWLPVNGELYETQDGGRAWKPVLETTGMLLAPERLHFGGGCVARSYDPRTLWAYFSPDCAHWDPAIGIAQDWRQGFGSDFFDGRHWLVGDRSAVRSTDDGGATWRTSGLPVPGHALIDHVGRFQGSWWALADDRLGPGPSALFHSTDGVHWSRLAVPGLA